MKFFSTLSFTLVAVSGLAVAAPSPLSARQEQDIVVTYTGLSDPIDYSFGDCIPFTLDGYPAATAEFNYFSKCYVYTDAACQQQISSAPVVVPPGIQYPNEGGVAGVVGESGLCYKLD